MNILGRLRSDNLLILKIIGEQITKLCINDVVVALVLFFLSPAAYIFGIACMVRGRWRFFQFEWKLYQQCMHVYRG